jgi:DNA-binding CsgD family transcriptional regulator
MAPETPSGSDRRVFLITAVLLGTISVLGITDILLDDPGAGITVHILVECVLLAASLGLMIFILVRWRAAGRDLRATRMDAALAHEEADAWRRRSREMLEGLGRQIDEQLRDWELTRAEREVALFLLKGFSHREIAVHLDKSERTVRQQATVIYDKSGLGGRAQLSAFFLEDLLLPAESTESDPSGKQGAPNLRFSSN